MLKDSFDRELSTIESGGVAVDGAKKQVVRIEKDGGSIPKIKPPDED